MFKIDGLLFGVSGFDFIYNIDREAKILSRSTDISSIYPGCLLNLLMELKRTDTTNKYNTQKGEYRFKALVNDKAHHLR